MVRKLLHIQNMDFTENNSSHGNDRKGNKVNISNTTIHKHTNILPITLVNRTTIIFMVISPVISLSSFYVMLNPTTFTVW